MGAKASLPFILAIAGLLLLFILFLGIWLSREENEISNR
jgi:hypothetical protein